MIRILYYSPDKQKQEQVKNLCRRMKLTYAEVSAKDLNRTVIELTGGQPLRGAAASNPHKSVPALYQLPEIMVMSGFSSAAMDVFLAEYKKAGIAPTPLKAAATPYNLSWTLYELAEELRAEHRAMAMGTGSSD